MKPFSMFRNFHGTCALRSICLDKPLVKTVAGDQWHPAQLMHCAILKLLYPFMTSKKTLIDFWKIFKRSYLQNGDELETHTWLLFFNGLCLPLVEISD